MKRSLATPLFAALLIGGCTGDRLLIADTSQFQVNSEPQGATVIVMGKAVGTTPMTLESKSVFPTSYPAALENQYGTVTLQHTGCEEYHKRVSNRILDSGLEAKLNCAATPIHRAESTSPSHDTRSRLIRLKSLFEEGLISEQEYRTKRSAILEEL